MTVRAVSDTDEGSTARAFYTVDEVAAILRVNHKTVREALRDGAIPHVRLGRTIRIPAAVITSMLKQGHAVPPEG